MFPVFADPVHGCLLETMRSITRLEKMHTCTHTCTVEVKLVNGRKIQSMLLLFRLSLTKNLDTLTWPWCISYSRRKEGAPSSCGHGYLMKISAGPKACCHNTLTAHAWQCGTRLVCALSSLCESRSWGSRVLGKRPGGRFWRAWKLLCVLCAPQSGRGTLRIAMRQSCAVACVRGRRSFPSSGCNLCTISK
jgi:hypothetical protein